MNKKILITGCSHAAGSEIDGTADSPFNRSMSFGNKLAELLGREPINIASAGSTNPTIARNVLEWCDRNYQDDLFVLVCWTESARFELPVIRPTWYELNNPAADWFSNSDRLYLRINQGWSGKGSWEETIIPKYQIFIAENLYFMEILSVNLVLQLQYFFQSKNIKYLMVNTMHMFGNNVHLTPYFKQIDRNRYFHFDNNDQSFYIKYKNAGYTNAKAQYWHHDQTPHELFSKELFNYIQ